MREKENTTCKKKKEKKTIKRHFFLNAFLIRKIHFKVEKK